MQRKFLTNLLLFLGLNLLIKPLWLFGIDLTVQNTVGDIYGLYFALFNFSVVFNMLLDFGITNFNNRSIAQSKGFLDENFSRLATLKLLFGVFYAVAVFAAGLIIGYEPSMYRLLIPLVVNQFLASFILYLRSNISGLLLFKTDSILSVIDRVIMIICCGILLWGNVTEIPFRIEWFVYIQTFAYVVTILLALLAILQKAKLTFVALDFVYSKAILKQSFPFAVLVFLTAIHNRMDAVFLERLLPVGIGHSQATIYASAFRLLDAAVIIAYSFSVLLLPLFARILSEKKSAKPLVKTSFTLIFIYGVVFAIISYFYSYPLMDLLYTNHVEQSSVVFKILMLSIIPLSATYIFGTLLTANGSLKKLNIIACVAIVINIGLNLLLIPYFQAIGSAIASFCTHFFIITAEIIIAIRVFSLPVSKVFVLRLFGFLLFSIAAGWISLQLPFHWICNVSILLFICLALVFVLGLIKPREVILLFKKSD